MSFLPAPHQKLLLLSCCAPCSAAVMEFLKEEGVELTVVFYNPNIQPQAEYEKRKEENKRIALELSIPFVDLDYDVERWKELVRGLEQEPEKGKRCDICFEMRLKKAAAWGIEHGFTLMTSVLGISRYKDFDQVNGAAKRALRDCPQMEYWPFNFRKKGGMERMYAFIRDKGLYHQDYCGCFYSQRN